MEGGRLTAMVMVGKVGPSLFEYQVSEGFGCAKALMIQMPT